MGDVVALKRANLDAGEAEELPPAKTVEGDDYPLAEVRAVMERLRSLGADCYAAASDVALACLTRSAQSLMEGTDPALPEAAVLDATGAR